MKVQLLNVDCLKYMRTLPDKAFNLAVVDPPYKDEVEGLTAGYNRTHFDYNHFKQPCEKYFEELFRVSEHQIIWGFNYFLEKLKNTDACIFWHKHQNGHFSEGELAWCSLGKTRHFDRPYQKDIGNKIHPTQKPIYLYDWIFSNYAIKGERILDTHLGSGSSRISADKYNLDFVGFELDKEHYLKQEERF